MTSSIQGRAMTSSIQQHTTTARWQFQKCSMNSLKKSNRTSTYPTEVVEEGGDEILSLANLDA